MVALAVQWSENMSIKKKCLKGREQTENLPFEEGTNEDLEEE